MTITKKKRTTKSHNTITKSSSIKSLTKKLGKKGGATMAAGAVGAVVGGALGAAAGVLLSDEKKRTTALRAAGTLKDQAVNMLDETAKQTQKAQIVTKKLTRISK